MAEDVKLDVLPDAAQSYESTQRAEINEWKHDQPGLLSVGAGFVVERLGNALGRFIPGSAMQMALNLGSDAGKFTSRFQKIRRRAGVQRYEELLDRELEECDDLAQREQLWAMGLAGTEGGVTGAFGLAGMAVDIPAIVTFATRSVHLMGLCYGFELKRPADRALVLAILAVSGANSSEDRSTAIAKLDSLNSALDSSARKAMVAEISEDTFGQQAILIAGKRLARDLAANLAKRKLAQAVPFVGSAVGAAVNAWYIRDVCVTARRTFQERWLRQNGRWAEPALRAPSGPAHTVDAEVVG